MPIDLDNLFLIYCICAVHFNLSSIITPKNFVLLTRVGSSTADQVLKYTKYPKYIPSTSTGQVLIFLKKYLST